MAWRKFSVNLSELSIDTTLRCGQSFRWKRSDDGAIYSCAIHGRLLSLRQDATHLHYRVIFPENSQADAKHVNGKSRTQKRKRGAPLATRSPALTSTANGNMHVEDGGNEDAADDDESTAFLRHYLNLGPDLGKLYEQWSTADANFKKKAPKFTGVRILRQDAWEALVGFICSSNNNIARICQMMDKLCMHYGPLIGYVGSQPFYDMPPPSALTGSKVESHLRELGFGYRAKYLHQTAVMITEEQPGWLDELRNPESPAFGRAPGPAGEVLPQGREGYRTAHEALLSLQGVGPKVADCVCLMGLGWGEAVPVDTHVWQIAQRDYKFGKGKHASLTKATYDAVGDHFRKLWGKEAGWAHSVLFTADLRAFSDRLSARVEAQPAAGAEVVDSTDQVVQIKVELAPAIPQQDDGPEAPLLKTEKVIAIDRKKVAKDEIPAELKEEIVKEAILRDASKPKTSRRTKRQKREQ